MPPKNDKRVERHQNPSAVMVWAGIRAPGKTSFIFVDERVKSNQTNINVYLLYKIN